MDWQLTLNAAPAWLAGIALFALAAYLGRWPRARWVMGLALCVAVWAWGSALGALSPTAMGKIGWAKIQALGQVGIPLLWLALIWQFTGREHWLARPATRVLGVMPILTLLLVFTNESHGWVWQVAPPVVNGRLQLVYGPWFGLNVVYNYTLVLASIGWLFQAWRAATGLRRQQALVLLLALVSAWLARTVALSPFNPWPQWDFTPVVFALSVGAVGAAIAWLRLLDLHLISRGRVLDCLADALLVVDAQQRLVDYNTAAQTLFPTLSRVALGQPVGAVTPLDLAGLATTPAPTQLTLGPRQYALSQTPFTDRAGERAGWVLTLRDITEQWGAENELRAQKQLFENLVAVAHAITQGATLPATLQNAINVAVTLTGAERGSLFLLDENGAVTNGWLSFGGLTPQEHNTIVRRVMARGLAGWLVRHREPTIVDDTAADDRWLFSETDPNPQRAALGVPILTGEQLVGVLTLSHSRPYRFTAAHLLLIQAAADQMALALRNAQIYEAQRRMADQQTALYNVLRAMDEQLTPRAVSQAAVQAIVTLVQPTRWSGVSVIMAHPTEPVWEIYAGNGPLALEVGHRFPLTRGVVGRAYATGQSQYVPDVTLDADYLALHSVARSELALPLRRGNRILGVFNVESDQLAAFDAGDRQLAESLADAIALALDNAGLYQAIADETSRLQALIKASRDGIVLIGLNRRLLVVNHRALELLQLPGTPETWQGRPLVAALLGLRRAARSALPTLFATLRADARLGELNVSPRYLHWLQAPVGTSDLQVGQLIVLRDVTDEKLLQQMREDLTSTMVHDLRNPLANIRMALEMLQGPDIESGDAASVLQIALNSTHRLLTLVNAILDANRLESGQMPLELEALDVRLLVGEVMQHQRPLTLEKRLVLQNAIPDLPPLKGDALLLRRVLENLLGNAIKFTPEGGTVTVAAERLPRAGPHDLPFVQVSVCDTGAGIPPETQAQLFQKFVTGKHRARGSGLGLAFCRLTIEAHGGRIWVESQPGVGTAFKFTLPFYVPD